MMKLMKTHCYVCETTLALDVPRKFVAGLKCFEQNNGHARLATVDTCALRTNSAKAWNISRRTPEVSSWYDAFLFFQPCQNDLFLSSFSVYYDGVCIYNQYTYVHG